MSKGKEGKKLVFCGGELGSIIEVRAIADGSEEGIVDAYLTKWDTVDSWNTMFKRGSFRNSFKTRGASGTRLIWNHMELAGKVLELREDNIGPIATVQFNLRTTAGKDAFEHVKAGDVPCFSFGFITIKDKWNGQIREIHEVDMLECGPVIFEANEQARIMNIRSNEFNKSNFETSDATTDVETREEDFDETVKRQELNSRGWMLLSSLEYTIDDIFYNGDSDRDSIIEKVDIAIAKFHTAYIAWLNEYYDQFESRNGNPPCELRNKLQVVMSSVKTVDLVKNTSFTEAEVRALKSGNLLPLESRSKLEEAGDEISKAFWETRSRLVEQLCDELRNSGLTLGESTRVEALLANNKTTEQFSDDEVRDMLRTFRETF